MRGFLTFLAAVTVVALGYWAYHQNIQLVLSIAEPAKSSGLKPWGPLVDSFVIAE